MTRPGSPEGGAPNADAGWAGMTFVFIELMVNFFREIMLTLLKAETAGEAGQKSLEKFLSDGNPARFWTAPGLWRFGVRTSERRRDDQGLVTRTTLGKR